MYYSFHTLHAREAKDIGQNIFLSYKMNEKGYIECQILLIMEVDSFYGEYKGLGGKHI